MPLIPKTSHNLKNPARPTTGGGSEVYIGIGLAVIAVIIWSGNFIVARGVNTKISPVSLAFYRWLTATIIMLPIAYKKFIAEWRILMQHKYYIFWTALTGVTLFNTLVYIAGHYSEAVNLALIGTTSSPVFSIILAAIFLRERISPLRIIGLLTCITGILVLLSRGSWERLMNFHFTTGDAWVLAAGFVFSIYIILVRKKPAAISNSNFLFTIFATGTLVLFAWLMLEPNRVKIAWNMNMLLIILYLGIGASVIAFLCWNASIARLGAGRTALFGNLIPIFSGIEAVLILQEKITPVHWVSTAIVIAGLVIANLQSNK